MSTSSRVNSRTQADFGTLVKRGDYEKCKEMLERINNKMDKVALVNNPSASGSTPLFSAAWDGRIDMCELLIEHGAKVNWKNLRGNTAISMAVEQNHVEIVELLLQNGCKGDMKEVEEIRARTQKKISPKIDQLIQNASMMQEVDVTETKQTGLLTTLGQAVLAGKLPEVIDLMKDKNVLAMINDTDTDGQTVLFSAAARGYVDIVKVLMDHGIDVNLRDKTGKSALHMAIAGNNYQVCKLLLEEGQANTTGVDMRNIRFWSMSNISQRIDNLLKKYPPKPLRPSKMKKSPIEGLTLKEFNLQKKIFKFFDTNKDGYISEAELKESLKNTTRGPLFDDYLVRQMIKVANSYSNTRGVSFEEFIEILTPPREARLPRKNSIDI